MLFRSLVLKPLVIYVPRQVFRVNDLKIIDLPYSVTLDDNEEDKKSSADGPEEADNSN